MINWITFEGKFVTNNPNLLVEAINQVVKQTNSQFYGEVYVQEVKDIPCERVKETDDETSE